MPKIDRDKDRNYYQRVEVLGQSQAEVARAEGVSEAAVSKRIKRHREHILEGKAPMFDAADLETLNKSDRWLYVRVQALLVRYDRLLERIEELEAFKTSLEQKIEQRPDVQAIRRQQAQEIEEIRDEGRAQERRDLNRDLNNMRRRNS